MFYTIYKITNLKNRKIYIGKHQTKDLGDGYMGSGKHLKRAISRYGVENFKKEILFVFDNEKEMNKKEAEIVNEEFVLREDTYNICSGGNGGFGYINKNNLREKGFNKKTFDKISQSHKGKYENGYQNPMCGKKHKELSKKKISEKMKNNKNSLGRKHSDHTKKKMSESQSNIRNSQYGSMWITNGVETRKINKSDVIPNGWRKGRKVDSS